MKAKFQNVLKSNVDPFFFALSCAMLLCISFTAKTLADDVLDEITSPSEITMMMPDGQLVWSMN